jgi:putative MFS transporter
MTPESSGAPGASLPPLTAYQRRLFAFLGVATFFEGYDFFALTMVLPHLRKTFELDYGATGLLLGVVNFGTMLAYLLVGKADRWGRRRVLSVTILGYTLFTVLSGLAPNAWAFGLMQMIARIFLIGEWATSMVMAAEEFPAARRGTVIGVVSATAGLGSVICAVVVPHLTAAFGWRSVYFAGAIPLLLLAWARRGLRETERFQARPKEERTRSIFALLGGPYRRRVLELGAIWFLTYVCTQNVVSLWKDYALGDLGIAESEATLVITIGAGVSMPLVFFAGKLFDLIGRRPGAIIVYLGLIGGVFAAYTLDSVAGLVVSMIAAVFALNSVLTLLNTFTTELFPTAVRGDAFLWTNNLIGRIGYVVSPVVAGHLAKDGGWGPVMRVSVVFPAIALVLLLWLLPETSRRELEQTSDLGAGS